MSQCYELMLLVANTAEINELVCFTSELAGVPWNKSCMSDAQCLMLVWGRWKKKEI